MPLTDSHHALAELLYEAYRLAKAFYIESSNKLPVWRDLKSQRKAVWLEVAEKTGSNPAIKFLINELQESKDKVCPAEKPST